MSGPVTYARDGDIAVISIDNPPVNALGLGVREGLVAAMDQFDADADARIAVIHGEGRTFPAGADISEFGKPPMGPPLPEVATRIEAATKPVVASIHGTSLGGGLEISMGAHYRIAQTSAKVGLPEIHLGIFPGAGGMIRAPKLIGFEKTLEIVHSGRHVKAAEALEMGLVDVVDESGDAKAAGIAYAQKLLAEGAGVRRTTDIAIENPGEAWFDAARAAAAKKARGLMNFVEAVNAMEGALMPAAEGMKHEREHYMKCHMSSQRAGMVHAFFSERAVAKVPEAKVEPRSLAQIGVIGGGTMGAGITAAALNAGLSVVMVEMNAEAVARGEAALESLEPQILEASQNLERQKKLLPQGATSERAVERAQAQYDVLIDQKRSAEADLLEARLRAPSRLRQLPPLLNALLGGERPPVASLELSFEGDRGSATATLRPGADAEQVNARVPAASITRREGSVLGLELGG